MNKERRRQLSEWSRRAEELKNDLENIMYEEQDYYNNIPENLQYSMRATDSEEAIENMEAASESLDEAISTIGGII